jgi:leader peptidase (prepilin peptidase) / N-methyltransferase
MLNRDWRAQCAELAAEDALAQPASAAGVPAAQQSEAATGPKAGAEAPAHPPAAAAVPESGQPERFNLMSPRSACPKCRRPIRAIENIPVISWLFLRGKCAGCGTGISARYPFVELLTGVLSAAVAWKLGFGWPVLGGLVLTWFLVALTFIDLDTQLLPDNMTLPLLWLGLFVNLLLPSLGVLPTDGRPIPVALTDSVIGAIAGYMSLWLVFHAFKLLTGKEGMGYGDFKLLAALGAWLGWQMLLPTILISAVVGAVSGIILLSVQKKGRSVPIAFGPFLAIAGWLMLMFGHEVVNEYLGLFGN